jgi:DnaK suppressor protein
LHRDIEAQLGRLDIDPPGDSMDQGRFTTENEVALRGIDRSSATLRLIEQALQKLGDGAFGTCAHCEEDIPSKRLDAVPWSPYCIACQERVENGSKLSESSGNRVWYAIAS